MDYKTYDYNTNEQAIKTKQKYSVSRKSMVEVRRMRERSRRKKRYKGSAKKIIKLYTNNNNNNKNNKNKYQVRRC